jgi:death on curing protein
MILRSDALDIHYDVIVDMGGSHGIRDEGALDSALARPFSGWGEMEFYPTAEEKASALVESIVCNHPFIDGNKRTGYVLMRMLLNEYGKDIKENEDSKYNFVVLIADGKMKYDAILQWIRNRIVLL